MDFIHIISKSLLSKEKRQVSLLISDKHDKIYLLGGLSHQSELSIDKENGEN